VLSYVHDGVELSTRDIGCKRDASHTVCEFDERQKQQHRKETRASERERESEKMCVNNGIESFPGGDAVRKSQWKRVCTRGIMATGNSQCFLREIFIASVRN
jgi:hypothetical protein